MTHHTTLVQRCRSTNSLLADELAAEFRRLENDRADAADEIEKLRATLADLEQMASAAGPFITGQAGGVAERLGKSIERARAVLTK